MFVFVVIDAVSLAHLLTFTAGGPPSVGTRAIALGWALAPAAMVYFAREIARRAHGGDRAGMVLGFVLAADRHARCPLTWPCQARKTQLEPGQQCSRGASCPRGKAPVEGRA